MKLTDSSDDSISEAENFKSKKQKIVSTNSMYLDTINRHMLDFDQQRLCSNSLSDINVYSCLVCGKFLQGKGSSSYAYIHSLEKGHHPFINLDSLKVYILPDGYQVDDASLNDIKCVIDPFYDAEIVKQLDAYPQQIAIDLNKKKYTPGFIGLNNFKANDYINVILQALAHTTPLRDYYLTSTDLKKSKLVSHFRLLIRKIWNSKSFKSHLSPHDLLQEVYSVSKKKFKFTLQSDPIEFLSWFLNSLHAGHQNDSKSKTIIHTVFQGKLQIESQKCGPEPVFDENGKKLFDGLNEITTSTLPFMFLTLDLPSIPLFQDEFERNIIPQIPIDELLRKYDGVTIQEQTNHLKRYAILELPSYLVFHVKRFNRNAFNAEKNNTMMNFPLRDLNVSYKASTGMSTVKYNLRSTICHVGDHKSGKYTAYVSAASGKPWYLMEDLIVEEVTPQTVFLSEAYIQVWERAV